MPMNIEGGWTVCDWLEKMIRTASTKQIDNPKVTSDEEGPRRLVRREAGIAAQHEHRAVREVQHAERAVDDRQPRTDQGQQCAKGQAVEELRKEVRPGEH
jgi:hypothetical protein